MGWSIGYDTKWKRDIGCGVPAICDHPGCNNEIDRGLAFVCGGEPYGGEDGCGLYFCYEHLLIAFSDTPQPQLCECCSDGKPPFPPKPDSKDWIQWKLTDESWEQWRKKHPSAVKRLQQEYLPLLTPPQPIPVDQELL